MLAKVRLVRHLVSRFFGSLSPAPPDPAAEAWAIGRLTEGEQAIWQRMSNPDRRHAIGVAEEVASRWSRSATAEISPEPSRPVLAAALLHDCGKVDADLGAFGRSAATVFWALVDDGVADSWLAANRSGWRGKLARYRRHPERGGELLRAAGADGLTVAWAAEHHRRPENWSIEPAVAILLKECDDD